MFTRVPVWLAIRQGTVRFAHRLAAFVRGEVPRRSGPRGEIDAIRIFHDLRTGSGENGLDPRTAADLDIEELFRRIDRSASAPGQQWLFDRLHRPSGEKRELDRFDALVSALPEAGTPESVRKSLSRLAGTNSYLLPYLLFEGLPPRPRWWFLYPLLTAAAVASLLASLVVKVALFALAAICAVNIVVRLSYRKRISPVLHSLPALRALIQAGQRLGRRESPLPETVRERIGREASPFRSLLRSTSWLTLETEQFDDATRLGVEYLNYVFLLDVNAFLSSLERLRRQRAEIRLLFETLGELDAAFSVAAFRASLPTWCRPTFRDERGGLRLEGGHHPLLKGPVANSLAVDGGGVLVTGSNMSGKTTFLKTVGLNALLARTIFTCPARTFEAPLLSVVSAIGRSESLAEGTSYYLGEVRRIRELVVAAAGRGTHLFLLDELFRGTNTVERIAAGKAVLAHLGRGPNVVLAASHDLELVPLLEGTYRAFHFRESLAGGALSFDYTLYPGPSSTRNAIALLASEAFPPNVVADALATAERLSGGEAPLLPGPP